MKLQYTENEAQEAVAFIRHLKAHKEVQHDVFAPGIPMCRICRKLSPDILMETIIQEEVNDD